MNQQPDITYEKVPPSISLPIQMQANRQDRFQPRPVTWIGKDFTERVIKIKPESNELLVRHPGKPKRSIGGEGIGIPYYKDQNVNKGE